MSTSSVIKLYATCFWEEDARLFKSLEKRGFGKATWKNITFTLEEDYDYAVVFTAPYKQQHNLRKKKTILFLTEPPDSPHHIPEHGFHTSPMYLTFSGWYCSKYAALNSGELHDKKTELLSSVTSELVGLDGHKKRLEMIYAMDRVITEGFDLFGKQITGDFFRLIKAYKGELKDKFDGLVGYSYHFACENSFVPDYFTEKIEDPVLAESLCFYDGCLNLEEYIDERAFIRVDVNDIQASVQKIITAIEADEYIKRRSYILQQKQRLLTELNPLNIIWAEVNGKDTRNYFKL